jgi:hypothetical protein
MNSSRESTFPLKYRFLRNFQHADLIFFLVTALWICLVLSSLLLYWKHTRATSFSLAVVAAKTSFEKDLVYRRWAAMHGGVYVTPTDKTPPNPYLSMIPRRDITTTTGEKLTLINPAYMTRQVHELGQESFGAREHITSLKPIRPENGADPWETLALQAFETGLEELSDLEKTGSE